jgi:uncharacterized membrane protein
MITGGRVLCLLCVLVGSAAQAQSSGGSYGGGSFSRQESHGGGSPGGMRPSRPPPNRSDSMFGHQPPSTRSSGDAPPPLWQRVLVIVVGLGVFSLWLRRPRAGTRFAAPVTPVAIAPAMPVAVTPRVEARVLSLGIGAGARADLQAQLLAVAEQASTAGATGLRQAWAATIVALLRARAAFTHAAGRSLGSFAQIAQAEQPFRDASRSLRVRFQRDTVRNVDGVRSTAAPGPETPRPDEGEGTVVVSLVLVAEHPLPELPAAPDADAVRGVLEAWDGFPASALVAFEVIWSPAEDHDRMSSWELETHYPELARLPGIAAVGAVTCDFCGGMLSAELRQCPGCGAGRGESGPS